jgi:hypothetical protein
MMQACRARSAGVSGRPRCATYAGEAMATRLSQVIFRDFIGESGSWPIRIMRSTPARIGSANSSEMRRSNFTPGCCSEKSRMVGTTWWLTKKAEPATHNVPLNVPELSESSASASAISRNAALARR